MKKLVTAVLFFSSFTFTSFSQITPFTYRDCILGTLRENYQPAPCEITGNSVPSSIWIIQVGAYRQNITPIPGVMMIPYELNRFYLFSFQDVGKYTGSLFFSTREAASSFITQNGLDDLFCQVFPAQFPFKDVIAYTTSSTVAPTNKIIASTSYDPSTYNSPRDTSIQSVISYDDRYAQNYVYHTVQAKENLYQLSIKYQTSIEEIKRLNNTRSLEVLSIGMVLRVK